jgi:hypothetical protein
VNRSTSYVALTAAGAVVVESIEELRQLADGRNDILAEAAGITAGSWYANPAGHVAMC